MRILAVAVLAWLLMFSQPSAYAQGGRQKVEKITGVVVAYNDSLFLLPCYHLCGGSLIVRVDKSEKPHYIRVDFGYPLDKFPKALVERSKQYRFRLVRTKDDDSPLQEFVPAENEKGEAIDVKLPMWRLVPGAESEKLPFGETLPSYNLTVKVSELIGEK
jgi:hypothetical protein